MPNYRHSEPYCLLKNMKDLVHEENNIAIKFPKSALKGGLVGSIFGYAWFVGGNTGAWEMNKLLASAGHRNYSGRALR